MIIEAAYTFDDVLLQPAHSTFGPADANVNTFITKDIKLNIPLLSAAMDTVTEHSLAITMAQLGGKGVLHKNFTIKDQASEVKKVKKFEAGMVVNPVTIKPDQTLGDAFKLMEKYKTSKVITDEEYAKWFNDLMPALLEYDLWRKNRNSRKIE